MNNVLIFKKPKCSLRKNMICVFQLDQIYTNVPM